MSESERRGERLVLDLETQRALAGVQGGGASALGLSVAVVWSYEREEFTAYYEERAGALVERLLAAEVVIGFNHVHFDLQVLQPYGPRGAVESIRSFDLLLDLQAILGHRVSLESCCRATLGSGKSGDGLQAIEWYRQGRFEELERYCKEDVRLTRDLFDHGRANGSVGVRKRSAEGIWHDAIVPVQWALTGEVVGAAAS